MSEHGKLFLSHVWFTSGKRVFSFPLKQFRYSLLGTALDDCVSQADWKLQCRLEQSCLHNDFFSVHSLIKAAESSIVVQNADAGVSQVGV